MDELLKAITEGLATESAPPPSGDTEDTADETSVEDTSGTPDDTDAGADPASGDGDEGKDGTGADDGADGDADLGDGADAGKKAAGTSDAGKTGTPDKAAEDAAKAAAAAKAKDPINDPLPPNLKEATRERMTSLIETAKTLTGRAEVAERQRDEIMGFIQESKATPEQYGQALEYLSMVNSGDPAKIEKALNLMLQEVNVLARMIGKPVPGVDMTAGHKDLTDAVAAGQITQAIANEIAAGREQKRVQTAASQHQSQQEQQRQQWQQQLTAGKQALNTLDQQLQADPHYAYKRPIIVNMIKDTLTKTPPHLWASAFKRAWDNLPAPAAAPAQRKPAGLPANQPLRSRNPAGGAKPVPKTIEDAIGSIDFSQIR